LIQLTAASNRQARIIRCWVAAVNTTAPTAQMISVRCRFLPATVTNGSGGSTPTIGRMDPGDAAATCTALANNTTKATTSGTGIVLEENGFHIFSGYDYQFPRPPIISTNEAFVFELLSTVSGTVNLSGGLLFEESGG
jgi:hypothetical protein